MPQDLPLRIGAALPVQRLPDFRDWLLDGHRDLEVQSFFQPAVLDGDWRETAAKVREHLDGYAGRLGIHGPFWSLDINAADPLIREVVTKRLLQGLEVCEALGATQMVVHSPYNTWTHVHLKLKRAQAAPEFETVHQTLDPVVARARDIGVEIVIENIQDIDPTLRSLIAESFDGGVVRVSLDTGHAHMAHCLHGAPTVDGFVNIAGDLLSHVHLQDTDGQADRHWSLGEGTIRWAAVFRAIAALDSRPRLVLELARAQDIVRSMRYLEDLGVGC